MTEHKNLKRLVRERQARTGESYTTARRHLIVDQSRGMGPEGPAALLSVMAPLLAVPRFQSVQATYRVWRHHDRLREARRADREAVRARGGSSGVSYSPATGDPQPAETVEQVRFWRQDDGFRYEIHGGHQDGVLFVVANGLW